MLKKEATMLKKGTVVLLFILTSMAETTGALAADRTEVIRFRPGAISANVGGAIKGYDTAKYVIGAAKGQAMSVLFSPRGISCYFNVIPPGSDNATFNGSESGSNEYSANLGLSGNYIVQVYMMRNAARRNQTCSYKLTVEISG